MKVLKPSKTTLQQTVDFCFKSSNSDLDSSKEGLFSGEED